jgi:hypothetical protein
MEMKRKDAMAQRGENRENGESRLLVVSYQFSVVSSRLSAFRHSFGIRASSFDIEPQTAGTQSVNMN